tara:strand:+ start:4395 stop:4622 length:228 start_codon:yes stop_codon:yes gene_type:complete
MKTRVDILKEQGLIMTKLKRVQKENDKLRHNLDIVTREASFWENQAKALIRDVRPLEAKVAKLEAQLRLWKGTSP